MKLLNEIGDLLEKVGIVVRGGKKVKVQLVRKPTVKKRLTSKQKAGFKKAAMKRKGKKAQIAKAQKKSAKVRGRLKLKPKDKKFKIGGG